MIALFLFFIPPALTSVYALLTQQYHMATNSFAAAACILVFAFLHRKFPLLAPHAATALQLFFLLSLFIGKALRGYETLPAWDILLHFLSGLILVSASAAVYPKCGGNPANIRLMRLFAFLFAVAGAGLWEIYEFALDKLFDMASQNGSLDDTMWDMIAGTVSAAAAIFGIKKRSP